MSFVYLLIFCIEEGIMAKSYTKDAIVTALIDLSRKKSIQKITINDIVNECEISKQTFYNHFDDKNDLLVYACYFEGRRVLKDAMLAGQNYKKAIMLYYERAITQKHFYRSCIKEPHLQILLLNSVADTSTEYVKKQIEHHNGSSELTPALNLVIRFNSAGNAKLFVDWIIDNMSISPETMANANFACIPEPLKSYFIYEEISSLY